MKVSISDEDKTFGEHRQKARHLSRGLIKDGDNTKEQAEGGELKKKEKSNPRTDDMEATTEVKLTSTGVTVLHLWTEGTHVRRAS